MMDFDRLGFARSALLRHSAERALDTAPHRADPRARAVVLAGEAPIFARQGEGATSLLALRQADALGRAAEEVFLGTLEGAPVFARQLDKALLETLDGTALFTRDLRSVAIEGLVEPGELGIIATARGLFHWHQGHRHCGRCGGVTVLAQAGFRRDCPACGAQGFPRTDPVAIMLVHRGERCLLARQARFVPGMFSCLAGFIEPGETIEDAVRRETEEESGLTVGAVRYLASQPWPFPGSLMIGCLAEAVSEDLTLDRDELEDGRWFSRDETRLMLARTHPDGLTTPPPMAIAHHLIKAWVEGAS
jgi:NAD+ diphosphatase